MLKLKNVYKYYKVGKEKKVILDNVTLDFKKGELVFILGASGSGKTTLLNVIAGNLRCDSGEIWLDNKCITKQSEKDITTYRNTVIGNIFQDYNLIDYMNVYDNIVLASNKTNDRNINTMLKQLSIYNKRKTLVSKLSGGEKQRVAIARALVNDPDIILADEPTGALDSKNGLEVMDILKKISHNKLVIVVSHDNYLANKYASRIINIKDGKCEYYPILDDSVITKNREMKRSKITRIIKLAIRNLWLKKGRTFFTSIAISIGIICTSLVVNLYSNFNDQISDLEKEVVSIFPITISNGDYEIGDVKEEKADDRILIKNKNEYIHTNIIDQKYIDYLSKIKEIEYITYDYDISLPIISDNYKMIDKRYLEMIPSVDYINDNYDILCGKNVSNKYEILLKVDNNNNVSSELLNYFGIDSNIEYDEIIGRKAKVALNDLYYIKNGKYYIINNNINEMYDNSHIELTIVGIIKEKKVTDNNNYLYYNSDLLGMILAKNSNSMVVHDQINMEDNILGLNILKNDMLSYLGYNTLPNRINIYVSNIEDKEKVLTNLDEYNKKAKKILYVDAMASSIEVVRNFTQIIGGILIVFSITSVVVSSLMIAILTNVRVLERKKEIGILRSLGARKKDIKKLFNMENVLIGVFGSIISLLVISIFAKPINMIMNNYFGLQDVLIIKYRLLLLVFTINILIIRIFGSIPAIRASKLEIINCIYNR